MFTSLEILFTDEGFLISKLGESEIDSDKYLLISLICKDTKVVKIKISFSDGQGKNGDLIFDDKYTINSSGLNFASFKKKESFLDETSEILESENFPNSNVDHSLFEALESFFTNAKSKDIKKLKNYFKPYLSVGDVNVKNFVEFRNRKLVSQNELCMLMSAYLIQMACYISFILMSENSIFSTYFGLIDFQVEKVMYDVCKNTLQDAAYAIRPNLISSYGLMNNYFNFCMFYINFWKDFLLDGPDSSLMKINIITGCTDYIIHNNEIIKNHQEFMLDKIKQEYEKLKNLQDNVCFNKREIRKTVESVLNSRCFNSNF